MADVIDSDKNFVYFVQVSSDPSENKANARRTESDVYYDETAVIHDLR